MDFNCAFQYYENNLHNLHLRCHKGLISKEARDCALRVNLSWLNHALEGRGWNGYDEIFRENMDKSDVEKYDADGTLRSIIYYRGEEIPCYDDDYGQQVYAKIRGADVSGGAYNLDYALTFCIRMNEILQDEMLAFLDKYLETEGV